MNAKRRIAELRRQIERADDLYYNRGEPELTDAEYDGLFRELGALEAEHPELLAPESPTQRIGAPLAKGSRFESASHLAPMLSIESLTEAEQVVEFEARIRRHLDLDEDEVIHYASLGNVFLGTMLPNYLNMHGVRTVLLSGFHLDWCIEQAARTCRDMGYMPIVIGDACGCGREQDEATTLERLDMFFAPVISADTAVDLIHQAMERRQKT